MEERCTYEIEVREVEPARGPSVGMVVVTVVGTVAHMVETVAGCVRDVLVEEIREGTT